MDITNRIRNGSDRPVDVDQSRWEKAVAFHGHECPGLAIGVRACEAAMDRLGITWSEDEDIVCITENDACGVDGIQALLSCTFGKGNLIYRGTGKQAFSFFDRKRQRNLRVYLKAGRPVDMDRTQWQAHLLSAPYETLFSFSEPACDVPEKARLFDSVSCALCGESAPEHKMRLQEGKTVCLDCFKNDDRGW